MQAHPHSDWHTRPAEDSLAALESGPDGLSADEARRRLEKHGPNRLPKRRSEGPLKRFLLQFHNLLIYVLLASCGVTLILGEWLDSAVIFGVVLINALVGFIQEGKAEQAMRAIQKMLTQESRVRRDGKVSVIDAEHLVPGDLVLLEAGDRVPADLRLLDTRDLRIEEAALTGESLPSDKGCEPVGASASLGDRSSMAYSGTLVSAGSGVGLVVATAGHTELGRISHMLGNVQRLQTPLLADMARFARQLTLIIVGLAAATFAFGVLLRDYSAGDMLMAAVGLAVAAIPEGLPAVLTIILALGVQRMARHRAIIRRLPAVESLGAVTVICSDKTGTLTRNEMTVQRVFTREHSYEVEGVGYAPHGTIRCDDDRQCALDAADDLLELARAGLLANSASLRLLDGHWCIAGDPTEAALLTLAGKIGLNPHQESQRLPRVDAIPFSSERRSLASLHHDHAGHGLIYQFGAPERLLEICQRQWRAGSDEPLERRYWHQRLNEGAGQGLRMIGLAMRPLEKARQQLDEDDLNEGFILLGLVGMIDPPREEAIQAIAECVSAGIAVKMITGDHAATAGAIARRLGLGGSRAMTGTEIDTLGDAELDARLTETSVFARTSPSHKLRLVERLQAGGARVAMTGDGVNDAPALKRADIGIAMGIKGTEAAKEAAQMVLADDNFATLVDAVAEGRTVYDNLKKSILFILPTNGGQALVLLAAIALGLPLPITPLQILWVNMITAVTLALTLAFEPAERGLMRQPPRDPEAPMLSGWLLWRVACVSLLLTAASLGIFLFTQQQGWMLEESRTLALNVLVAGEIGYLFSCRRLREPAHFGARRNPMVWAMVLLLFLLQLAFTYWSPLQRLFGTAALGPDAWGWCLLAAVGVCLEVELEKAFYRWRRTQNTEHEVPPR
ncbi:Cation transporting ATPase [Azotobacter vinelandii CA]|uniref:Cation transporting ATPase, N-terminal:Haloacid dehalogenase-like hydrolase:Cation transporting ATPase, C-terminal:E1-E2 ATPase-associated region protein n=2 Tax=Azotobacter vinelandii TaxID=354 RepID=C1DGH0_AZOVD|nr:cation-transporting P-type ATPase [Azotobacter vinelandii]ACO78481.1 Cation transporting ATPase, N-terminal:Haloacid dehalogenase-like hydrolase:Cation transporting ATPase, C-terminal:E1-E2 ATPase-associated region protein [Azotobacter vinelandii DJ]AGK13027.1 Cation transporting ATPase [Azotobacter vinelandii CA]AGK20543.1 Cation transporting ATPase [Azotobacter vinelandii CA6]SFX60686.1 potassium and/or sodium efflux P-type ATPase [Azotobacter vinelandii]GLK61524.1 cation-transporting P-t